MFSNKQSLFLTGIVGIGFFITGIIDFLTKDFNILDNLIVKIIFGSLFLLILINLFLHKKVNDNNDIEDNFNNNNYLE